MDINYRFTLLFLLIFLFLFINLTYKVSFQFDNLSYCNFVDRLYCSFFVGFVFSHDAYEGETLSVFNFVYFWRAHICEPLFGTFWKFCNTVIFTGSDNNKSIWITFNDEIIECDTWYVCVKYSSCLNLAVVWINNDNVQPSLIVVFVTLYTYYFSIQCNFCELTSIKARRCSLNDQSTRFIISKFLFLFYIHFKFLLSESFQVLDFRVV